MPPRKLKLPEPNMELLHPDKVAEIQKLAKSRVDEKRRKKAEEELLAKLEREYEMDLNEDPDEEMRQILLDLPGHAVNICVDGFQYQHGHTYTVKRTVFDFLQAQVQAAWRHEDEIGGANRNAYRKPSNPILSGKNYQGGHF